MTTEEKKFRGRWYVAVDSLEAEDGDIAEYIEQGFTRCSRTHRVTGRRGGKDPAVRVQWHEHENGSNHWIPIRDVVRVWRRRAGQRE